MSHAQPRQYFASTQRAVRNADAIEWEELPSLAKRLVNRSQLAPFGGANDSRFQNTTTFDALWSETKPAEFDAAPASQPFVERLDGLVTREVIEPDVFQHFFGPHAEA